MQGFSFKGSFLSNFYLTLSGLSILILIGDGGCTKSQPHLAAKQADSSSNGSNQQAPSVFLKLPSHFAFGVSNSPNQANLISNMKVEYRYQYLSGDVTGSNWTAYNTPSGAFATFYMNESAQQGMIPVFSYYMIVQSSPNKGKEPPLDNLNTPSTMNAYYDNWKILMQRCKEFSKPVIVHVEPDMAGFIQHQVGVFPDKLPVSVGSSGYADAAGFENNARGMIQLLLKMRNTYAPNVLLAWHASQWATGTDLILNHGDPDTIGTKVAAFYKALKAPFDLIFTDVSDRDAGFYQAQQSRNTAWAAPDFITFCRFAKRLNTETGLKIMLWQVPLGNTLYASCNNTWDHYQDNRPEYFLQSIIDNKGDISHIKDYAGAGVIGILFGRGADGNSDIYDNAKDGITNPAPINGNIRQANVADDDGGFIRQGITAYYNNGTLPLKQ